MRLHFRGKPCRGKPLVRPRASFFSRPRTLSQTSDRIFRKVCDISYAVCKCFFGFRNYKSENSRRCAHVVVFTTSRSYESLKNQLEFVGLPKSHPGGFHLEDALEDSHITQQCCQEFLVTLSRRLSQHHVGCKLLAAENPHSVRYRAAMRTSPWNPSSKTRATEGCMRPRNLQGCSTVRKPDRSRQASPQHLVLPYGPAY